MYQNSTVPDSVFELLVGIADKLSDKVYLQYVDGELSQPEMESYFKKIETWSQLTQELADLYGRAG